MDGGTRFKLKFGQAEVEVQERGGSVSEARHRGRREGD